LRQRCLQERKIPYEVTLQLIGVKVAIAPENPTGVSIDEDFRRSAPVILYLH
jgi:hypothetical protein